MEGKATILFYQRSPRRYIIGGRAYCEDRGVHRGLDTAHASERLSQAFLALDASGFLSRRGVKKQRGTQTLDSIFAICMASGTNMDRPLLACGQFLMSRVGR
jgi:hypothetical protein